MATPSRTRYITDSELRRIKHAAAFFRQMSVRRVATSGPMMCGLIDLLYLTGQAISDVLALEADDVQRGKITFRRSKVAGSTGQAVTIVVTPALQAAIGKLLAVRADVLARTRSVCPALVVTQEGARARYDGISTAWARACERAGIKNAHIHDIKAKSITDVERKRGMQDARLIGQHSTEKQTAAYVRNRAAAEVKATR